MTVQEFYAETGGDYNEIMSRLRTDERVVKFAKMFTKDESFHTLVHMMQEGNVDEAFRAAHTMKGVCQNMAFTKLFESSHAITEALRAKNMEEAKTLLTQVTEDYNRVMDGIAKLTNE